MSKRTSSYERELDAILAALSSEKSKPSLLLHACCAPCSSYTIEYLSRCFDITIFYYNPNIFPKEEHDRRLGELEGFVPRFPLAADIRIVKVDYDHGDFLSATNVQAEPELMTEREKGERCRRCYLFRMEKAYRYAQAHGFDYFTTTLSISPFKDADKINAIGKQLESEDGEHDFSGYAHTAETCSGVGGTGLRTKFLPSDFKKKGGFLRSLELSKEYGLYRQDYCGCEFSKAAHSSDGD